MRPVAALNSRSDRSSQVVLWIFIALILVIYLLHAAPGAWWGDGQELACAAWTLGIPHPTGYPLYTLLGHGWMKLLLACGLDDPGRALTWLSALELAVALGLIARVLQRVILENPARLRNGDCGGSSLGALVPALGLALLLAFGRTLFEHATFAEVYPLTFLLAAIIISIAWRTDATADSRLVLRGAWLGAVFGLALLNHYSILALAPLALIVVLKWERRIERPWLTVALAFGCGALMLLGYLYLPLRAQSNPPLNWGDPSNWERLQWVLKGGQFHELKMGAEGEATQGLMRWFAWWGGQWIPAQYANLGATAVLGTGLLAIAFGGLILFSHAQAALGWGLILSLVATAFFAAFYHIPDIDAYFLPALPAAAIGWLVAGQWTVSRLRQSNPGALRSPFFRVVPLALGCIVFLGQRETVDKHEDDAPSVWGQTTMNALPLNAMILTQADNDIYALWYQQMVLGNRLDVTVYGQNFIFQGWYRKMFEHGPPRPAIVWSEKRKIGSKIDYDMALFEHILLPNLEKGNRVFTTFIDPLFQEYFQPAMAVKGPLLPDIYYHRPEYRFGLPSPFIYELHPNPNLANRNHDELMKTFHDFYAVHPKYAL